MDHIVVPFTPSLSCLKKKDIQKFKNSNIFVFCRYAANDVDVRKRSPIQIHKMLQDAKVNETAATNEVISFTYIKRNDPNFDRIMALPHKVSSKFKFQALFLGFLNN